MPLLWLEMSKHSGVDSSERGKRGCCWYNQKGRDDSYA